MADTDAFMAPGSVLAGKYRVERELGRGGMGTVLVVLHLGLEERRALKLLSPQLAEKAELRARFLREARAAARLRSEHVVRVHDVGEIDGFGPYIEMELLEGADLAQSLKAHGPPPISMAVGWILEACSALAEAHGLGIVHRDLKPANLFLTRRADGRASLKILDFGIAKVDGPGVTSLTTSQASFGSPLYMAPEQLRASHAADARSDVWALGVVLYELCTGRPPFVADSLTALAIAIDRDAPAPPSDLRAELPHELDPVILRCLAKKPEARYQSVNELAAALLQADALRAEAASRTTNPPAQASAGTTDPFARTALAADSTDGKATPERGSNAGAEQAYAAVQTAPAANRTTGDGATRGSWTSASEPPKPRRTLWALGLAAVAVAVVGGLVVGRFGTAPAAPARGVSSAAPASSSVALTLREPKAGLEALRVLRLPARGSEAAQAYSSSLWRTAQHDFAEAASQPGAPRRWAAAERVAAGWAALSDQRPAEAETAFFAARALEPEWSVCWYSLAQALSAQNKPEAALEAASNAERFEPSWFGGARMAGRALADSEKLEEAIQAYRRAVALAPKNPVLLGELALVLHAARLDDEADRTAAAALELDPDLSSVRLLRAERALERKESSVALNEAMRAAAADPKSAMARLVEARALLALKRVAEARHSYERAESLREKSQVPHLARRFAEVRDAIDRTPGSGAAVNPRAPAPTFTPRSPTGGGLKPSAKD